MSEADFLDLSGNPLGDQLVTRDFSADTPDAIWINSAGGFWDDPANWQGGVLPEAGDSVLILLDGGAQITHRFGSTVVDRILVDGELTLTGGTLTAESIQATDAVIQIQGGTLQNASLIGLAGSEETVVFTAGTLDGVTLNADAVVDASATSRTISVQNGLTLNSTLSLAASTNQTNATINFLGEQILSGTGQVFFAGDPNSFSQNTLQLVSQQNGAEILTIGADITLVGGNGQVRSNSGTDSVQVLGRIASDGLGNLVFSNIDNSGIVIQVDATNGGISLGSASNATIVGLTPDTFVRATSLNNVVLNTDVLIDSTNTFDRTLTVTGGLTLNSRLILETNDTSRTSTVNFVGDQLIDGKGEIVLGGTPFSSSQNRLTLVNNDSNMAEVLTFGEEITISGVAGTFSSNNQFQDTIQILGTIVGQEDGELRLDDIDNNGEAFTIDAANGGVALAGQITDAVINGTTGTRIEHLSGSLNNVTLNTDLLLDATPTSRTLGVTNGLVLNGALIVAGSENRTARVDFSGEQSITGTGEIVFAGTPNTASNSILDHNSITNVAEILTIGEQITIQGNQGRLSSSNPSQDAIQFLGTVVGEEGGQIQLDDIVNDGESFTVDAVNGGVVINGQISDAVINGTQGTVLEQFSGSLTDVTLNTDLILDAESGSRSLTVNNLTLNGLLTLAGQQGNTATVTFTGEQTLDGTGGILFAGLPTSINTNTVTFSGTTSVSEIFTIGSGIEIQGGRGRLISNNANQDRILLQGSLETEEGGRIDLSGVDNAGVISAGSGTVNASTTTCLLYTSPSPRDS